MLNKSFKRVVVSAMLGLSVLTASAGVSSVVAPVTVEAATAVAPTVNLKAKTFTVGLGSQLDVYKNVIKSVKRGTYSVKSVKIAAVKAANGKKIGIKNSPILTTGKIPAKTLVFPTKAGTYKLKVVAADTKGNKRSATIAFKVGSKKLSSYVTGLKHYKLALGEVKSVNFMKGVKFNKAHVKSVKCNSAMVDLENVNTYKIYYTITGVAGDKQKVTKKVAVYKKMPSYDAGPTTPTPTTPAETGTPASHVKGITDRVALRASKNFNLMDGVSWDSTIQSVQCLYSYDDVDPYHYNLPAFGEPNSAIYMYTPEVIDYLITTKAGKKQRVECNLYVVDLPTAKDLAQYVPVYASNGTFVQADPNVRRTCTLQVSATKIIVPRHILGVCYNCNEEMDYGDFEWIVDDHNDGNWWKGVVEAFTINR